MIKNETLSLEIIEKQNNGEVVDLNGIEVKIDVLQVKKRIEHRTISLR